MTPLFVRYLGDLPFLLPVSKYSVMRNARPVEKPSLPRKPCLPQIVWLGEKSFQNAATLHLLTIVKRRNFWVAFDSRPLTLVISKHP